MDTTNNKRCAHRNCRCGVAGDEAYCSEHCRKRAESPTSSDAASCQCGHPECIAGTHRAPPPPT